MLLQWSTYDEIDHELTHIYRDQCLSSSYTIRKALIRKHFLSNCIRSYVAKNPSSILTDACPITYEIEISFADELDELWTDELWELAEKLEESSSWWILKPGMADRGMGIRLFDSKDALQSIFEEFDGNSEDESDADAHATSVVTSQLRHFVIQEYINNPLLIDPSETAITDHSRRDGLRGHKFHLRAYCVANGALELYLYDRVLALFSAVPYEPPRQESTVIDLSPHLTNTSLQAHRGEVGVRLLQELVGCRLLSGNQDTERKLTTEDVDMIVRQMGEVLAETFKAALQMPVHFQAIPNAFELFGVDFLVHEDETGFFKVKLLEINAEPAIELTGPRLSWILEDLFIAIGKVCIEPFFARKTHEEGWETGETRDHLMKCFAEEIRW
ncbi:hypothetical protein M378DRAFT_155610 [Amanita muscaria Koide BX008]|uniref:Tubulin-tyrosine ligase n=1 Tax=Amanita muscaria (strain Koide BX008) TaxID=946122 RepID=A0A0C2XNE4_AMAMK|nr:hypothetical protein M378DRAFT_155610 [Amanita muscaria Koide BX008]